MHALVAFQSRQHWEALTALRAGEGALGSAVAEAVALETRGVPETLSALGANEGLLAGVDALVLPQVAQIVEMTPAVAALISALHFLLPCTPANRSFCASQSSARLARVTLSARGRTARGRLQSALVVMHEFDVLLQERGVRAKGSTEGADEGVRGELLTWKRRSVNQFIFLNHIKRIVYVKKNTKVKVAIIASIFIQSIVTNVVIHASSNVWG